MDSAKSPSRRTEEMHRGRISSVGTRYFLTLVTKVRQPWLAAPRTREVFLAVLRSWHAERNGRVLAATIMPDHVHILLELGSLLTVAQLVARWKASTQRGAGYAETFQRDFWEHRLRDTENIEDYGLYMFLNPYRALLLPANQPWPGWWLPDAGLFRFPTALDSSGGAPQEWIAWPAERFSGLAHGE